MWGSLYLFLHECMFAALRVHILQGQLAHGHSSSAFLVIPFPLQGSSRPLDLLPLSLQTEFAMHNVCIVVWHWRSKSGQNRLQKKQNWWTQRQGSEDGLWYLSLAKCGFKLPIVHFIFHDKNLVVCTVPMKLTLFTVNMCCIHSSIS